MSGITIPMRIRDIAPDTRECYSDNWNKRSTSIARVDVDIDRMIVGEDEKLYINVCGAINGIHQYGYFLSMFTSRLRDLDFALQWAFGACKQSGLSPDTQMCISERFWAFSNNCVDYSDEVDDNLRIGTKILIQSYRGNAMISEYIDTLSGLLAPIVPFATQKKSPLNAITPVRICDITPGTISRLRQSWAIRKSRGNRLELRVHADRNNCSLILSTLDNLRDKCLFRLDAACRQHLDFVLQFAIRACYGYGISPDTDLFIADDFWVLSQKLEAVSDDSYSESSTLVCALHEFLQGYRIGAPISPYIDMLDGLLNASCVVMP